MTAGGNGPPSDDALDKALEAWRRIVGDSNVTTEQDVLSPMEQTTFATTQRITARVRPKSAHEVADCMRVANDFLVRVHPVSGGKNWGYGSRVPAADRSVALDLARMNSIVDYDEKLACVTVEPGVTFRQLHAFMAERNSPLMICVPGTSPDASIVGNTVERGLGIGPLRQRFEHVAGLQVVLPTGERIHAGFDRYANAKAGRYHRWGVGPALDGLFTQSNLGIVTRLTAMLMPRPQRFALVSFRIDHGQVGAVMERLGASYDPSLEVRIQSPSRHRASAAVRARRDGLGAAPSSARTTEWIGIAAIYGQSVHHERHLSGLLRRALRGNVSGLRTHGHLQLVAERWLQRALGSMGGWLSGVDPIWVGVPSDRAAWHVYSAKSTPPPDTPDLDRDRCGVIWVAPAIPCRAGDVDDAIRDLMRASEPFGMDVQTNLRLVERRVVDVVSAIIYDRDTSGADARARACHDAMLSAMVSKGYYPYRLGIQSMDQLPATDDDWDQVLTRIKHALDPMRVLSPRRYERSP